MKKQRKHINLSRITAFILSVAMLAGFCPQGVSLADIPITLPKVNAAENISNPRIAKDSSMDAGQKVTWDCVYFGRYPQSEITSKDGSIYNTLKNATGWDENNDITIGRTKYRRLKGEDATYATGEIDDEFEYYDWNGDYKTYHYFKYEPIKWRVLNRNGNDALLFADVALDSQKYNTNYEDVTWETSSMRSWLNGYGASVNQPKTDYSRKNFIDSAFTSTQKNAIKTTNVVNNNNIDYGTAGAVPMRMRWVHIEVMTQSIQNTMEIFGGGSARRASRAIMRPKCISMAGATGMAVMSTILLTVCGPLCI